MFAILTKEIQGFFDSAIAYVAIGVFLVGMGLFTWVLPATSILVQGMATLEPMFVMAPYVYLVLVPAITMRSLAEERRQGTLELLLTRPLTEWSIVLGKFLAAWVLVAMSLAPTLVYYMAVYALGQPAGNLDSAGIGGSYIGLLLLGGVFCAVGLLASSLSHNQVTAFVGAAALCLLLYQGLSAFSDLGLGGRAAERLSWLSISYHYQALSRGVIDTRNVLYLGSMITVALAATRLRLAARTW